MYDRYRLDEELFREHRAVGDLPARQQPEVDDLRS